VKKICCVCHKTETLKGWAVRNTSAGEKISHGYCPVCFQQLLGRINSHVPTRNASLSTVHNFPQPYFDLPAELLIPISS